MDRTELKKLLEPFQAKCAENGKPFTDVCLEEAFPGDSSTSYIIQVKASWIDVLSCSDALDFLFDVLWQTTNENTRRKIFSIQLVDSLNQLHCEEETTAVSV